MKNYYKDENQKQVENQEQICGSADYKKQGQIERELKNLSDSVTDIEIMYDELCKKLVPISLDPCPKIAEIEKEEEIVELARMIKHERQRICKVYYMFEDMLKRIEL